MDAINYCITRITESIPRIVLEQTFLSNIDHRTSIPITLEARINDIIMQGIINRDTNIIGGTVTYIPLNQCTILEQRQQVTVYKVPAALTDHLPITSVLEVLTPGTGLASAGAYMSPTSSIASAAIQQANSVKNMRPISFGKTMLINSRTVLVEGPYHLATNNMIKVRVGHDAGFNSIEVSARLQLAELSILACKKYIYNQNRILVNEGYIKGGANLTAFKEVVEEYRDAEEMYNTMLKTDWAVVDKLNDHVTRNQLTLLITGQPM